LGITWNFREARELFTNWSEAWQLLNRDCNKCNPVLDIKFIRSMYRHFHQDERIILAIEEELGKTQSVMLVQKGSLGRWRLFMPSQAVIGPIIMRERHPQELSLSLKALCRALPNYAWEFGFQRQDPNFSVLVAIDLNSQISIAEHSQTTFVDVSGQFADYWAARPKNIRATIRKALQQLEQDRLETQLDVLTDVQDMDKAVDRHADLESRGWKGKMGTAIGRGNVQGSFYKELMSEFARKSAACVYQLFFDNSLIASLLTLKQSGMQVVLKTAYDESHSKYAPGRLIDYLMLQKAFVAPDVDVVENYTQASRIDLKWATGSRPIFQINYYRQPVFKNLYELGKSITRRDSS
jgi:hypothetical protein